MEKELGLAEEKKWGWGDSLGLGGRGTKLGGKGLIAEYSCDRIFMQSREREKIGVHKIEAKPQRLL